MTIVRCKADITVRTRDGFGRRFGPGAFVDLDEQLGEGVTVRAALGARVDSCCEPLEVSASPSPSFVDTTFDGEGD